MKCDPDDFRHLVEKFDLSSNDQDELIHTVWRVMESVVDRAWNADPVQMALVDRDNIVAKDALDSGPVIELERHEYCDLGLSNTFNMKEGDKCK